MDRLFGCNCPYCLGPHDGCIVPGGQAWPYHGAIVTRDDDPLVYDESIIGPVPNGYQYGYCERCHAPLRWNVEKQQLEVVAKTDILADLRRDALAMLREVRLGFPSS